MKIVNQLSAHRRALPRVMRLVTCNGARHVPDGSTLRSSARS